MQALRQVDILKKQLDELLPMKEEYKRELDKKIRLEFNYNSNHLEGNTLTYQETELLLYKDLIKGNHEMRELEEMKAHDVAYAMIENWASDKDHTLTEADIRSLNEIILVRAFWKDALTIDGQPTRRKIKVGQYKEQPNSVQLSNGEMFHYASPADTPIKMGELIQWYRDEEEKQELHSVALAAMLHYRFVCIHPFDDGNGRISRLLMNYVLLKASLPPIVIKSSEKKNYLQALHMADTGDLNAFADYIAEQQLWSLNLYIRAAKGEGVDEPGDLDKKLAALKKKLNSTKEVTVEKNGTILYARLVDSVHPFLKLILQQLGQFDSLFKSKNLLFEYHGHNYDGYPKQESLQNIDDVIQELAFFEDVTFLKGTYALRYFRAIPSQKEPVAISFVFKFYSIIYEFDCPEAGVKFDKMYDEVISIEESNSVAEKIGNILYKKIEPYVE